MELTHVHEELNKILGNPTGVSATEVTALRDKVATHLEGSDDAVDESETEENNAGSGSQS